MAKDAITMFKEAAAQLQREEAYLALEGTRKKNDEDEALQQLIGDFNLARIDLNSELSKSADKDQDKVNELNVDVYKRQRIYQALTPILRRTAPSMRRSTVCAIRPQPRCRNGATLSSWPACRVFTLWATPLITAAWSSACGRACT